MNKLWPESLVSEHSTPHWTLRVPLKWHEIYMKLHTPWTHSRSIAGSKNTCRHTPPEAPPQSLKTTIKSHYGGVAALQEPMLTSQRMRGGLGTQGKDNRGRYNHYLHKARVTSLQQGQHVGNLHLNRMDDLWGEIRSPNSLLSQISLNACRGVHRCTCSFTCRFLKCSTAPLWS